jgi:hypothetical protein
MMKVFFVENIFNRLREWRRNFYPMYKFFAVHVIAANILTPEDCEVTAPKQELQINIYFSVGHVKSCAQREG